MRDTDKVALPMYGDMEVTRELFELTVVLLEIEKLKDNGILEGGYEIDEEALTNILSIGREYGYQDPDDCRCVQIVNAILDCLEGGDGDDITGAAP